VPPKAATVAATAAGSQFASALGLIAAVAIAYLVVTRALPKLGDLAVEGIKKGGEELGQGIGEFVQGVFTGAKPTETTINLVRTADNPNRVFELTRPGDLASGPIFVPGGSALDFPSYRIDTVDGETVVTVTNPNPALPTPRFFEVDQASVAQRVGAGATDAILNDPILGVPGTLTIGQIGGVFADPVGAVQDLGSDINSIFRRIF